MSDLWRGNWATCARIGSGLALMLYALLHFLNIGLGLFSPDWLAAGQDLRQIVTRNPLGEVLLYAVLIGHAGLALLRLTHITYTRVAHEVYGVDDQMGYLMYLIWGGTSALTQTVLLLIVWGHGCIGLHLWLRGRTWWRHRTHLLTGLAVLAQAFALSGFVTESRRLHLAAQDEDTRLDMLDAYNFLPGPEAFSGLIRTDAMLYWGFVVVLGTAIAAHLALRLNARRTSVRITYTGGPAITARLGQTLLEMSREAGVPHTSLCGGKGRCTTCRVRIEENAQDLPPSEAKVRSLLAVGATSGTRLACQLRPEQPMRVHRIFADGGQMSRGPASQGQERPLVILFLDMRGFTARTAGQLPYDVVIMLNRFFDAVVPAVTASGGKIDKYLGDGFLALFETRDTASSAQAGLSAAAGIARPDGLVALDLRGIEEPIDALPVPRAADTPQRTGPMSEQP